VSLEKKIYEQLRSLFVQRFNKLCPLFNDQQLDHYTKQEQSKTECKIDDWTLKMKSNSQDDEDEDFDEDDDEVLCLNDVPKSNGDDEIQVIEPQELRKLPSGTERIKMDMQPFPKRPLSQDEDPNELFPK